MHAICFGFDLWSLLPDRTGSEFWKLPERLGDEETGIQYVRPIVIAATLFFVCMCVRVCTHRYTLTKTERGQPPEVEYIGMPSVVCKEKGDYSHIFMVTSVSLLQLFLPLHYSTLSCPKFLQALI